MARLTMIVLVGPRNFEEILEKKHLKLDMNVILNLSWGKKHFIMEMNDY